MLPFLSPTAGAQLPRREELARSIFFRRRLVLKAVALLLRRRRSQFPYDVTTLQRRRMDAVVLGVSARVLDCFAMCLLGMPFFLFSFGSDRRGAEEARDRIKWLAPGR